ncbi:hypothetical protein J0S82_009372, partial [Galemys pyrenaicus]
GALLTVLPPLAPQGSPAPPIWTKHTDWNIRANGVLTYIGFVCSDGHRHPVPKRSFPIESLPIMMLSHLKPSKFLEVILINPFHKIIQSITRPVLCSPTAQGDLRADIYCTVVNLERATSSTTLLVLTVQLGEGTILHTTTAS